MKKPHEPKYSTLACELAGAVRTITLNRPEHRNAISGDMIEDLLAALANAEADHAVRVVIITGAGKAFCSGMDLEMLQSVADQTPERKSGRFAADGANVPACLHFSQTADHRGEWRGDRRRVRPGDVLRYYSGGSGSEVRLHRSAHRIYSRAGFGDSCGGKSAKNARASCA